GLGTAAGTNKHTLSATSAGLTNSPLTFTASAPAGSTIFPSTTLFRSQSATVSTSVGTAPSVLVRDAFNNPVTGTTVTFTVTAGAGQINHVGGLVAGPPPVNTPGTGVAALTAWQLGALAGTNKLTAAES